jgi:pimeloyl-ACP methyl ester carboxylesterase
MITTSFRILRSSMFLLLFLWPTLATSQDLAPLFAPATSQEMVLVENDWARRSTEPSNAAIDRTVMMEGFRMQRISFHLDNLHQYGVLRYPKDFTPGQKFPVLMLLHGGFSGFWFNFPLNFDADYTSGCLADSFFVVCPTYRGEDLAGGDLGNVSSEGEPSVWDRDCDDSMAMLTAVLSLVPELDPDRVTAHGGSRGGNVAYHMAVRDPRVKRTVVLFGPSQFRQADIQSECQDHIDGIAQAQSSLAIKVISEIIEPWNAGQLTLFEARHLLTAWSICDFLPPEIQLQVHHGLADEIVLPVHSFLVAEQMEEVGGDNANFALHTYPDGNHNPSSLVGHDILVEDFLCSYEEPFSANPPMQTGLILKVWPNPFYGHLNVLVQASSDADKTSASYWGEVIDLRGHRVGLFEVIVGREISWPAHDLQGRPLPSGQYRLQVVGHPDFASRQIVLLR